MNQLFPYERVITKKMELLPVPNMADSIWGNIQAQLNTGLGDLSKNRNEVLQNVPLKTSKLLWWIAGCIVLIIVTVLLLKQKKHSPPSKISIPEKTEQTLPKEKSKNATETSQVSNHNIKTAQPANGIIMDSITIIPKAESSLPIGNDSAGISKVSPIKSDSIVKTPVIIPGKKSIGIKGISDSSYRIAGKRDSMK